MLACTGTPCTNSGLLCLLPFALARRRSFARRRFGSRARSGIFIGASSSGAPALALWFQRPSRKIEDGGLQVVLVGRSGPFVVKRSLLYSSGRAGVPKGCRFNHALHLHTYAHSHLSELVYLAAGAADLFFCASARSSLSLRFSGSFVLVGPVKLHITGQTRSSRGTVRKGSV